MTTALVLVDLQNDFMPGGALAVDRGDEVVSIANDLMPHYDIVVATQDWHPEDHGSFAANHDAAAVFDTVPLNGLEQILWPVHCVAGSPGAAFHTDVHRPGITQVFPKGCDSLVDSYSGFFDNGKRRSTGMGEWLRAQGVDTIDVMGLATDYCVQFTAIDGAQSGFTTRLLLPGCRAVGMHPGDEQAALQAMEEAGVSLVRELPDGVCGTSENRTR